MIPIYGRPVTQATADRLRALVERSLEVNVDPCGGVTVVWRVATVTIEARLPVSLQRNEQGFFALDGEAP